MSNMLLLVCTVVNFCILFKHFKYLPPALPFLQKQSREVDINIKLQFTK